MPPTPHRTLTIDGETRLIVEWAKISGISSKTITARVYEGWPAEEAVFRPSLHRERGLPVLRKKRAPVAKVAVPPCLVGQLPRWGSVVSVTFRRAA